MVTLDIFKNSPAGRPFRAGEPIFTAGDVGDRMYVIVEGTVRLSIAGKVLEVLGPGQAFGELSLIDDGPHFSDAVAVTDGRVVEIDEERFRNLVHQKPEFSLQVMRVMADRLRHLRARIAA